MSYNMKKSNLYGDSFMTKAKYQRIVDKITKDIKEGNWLLVRKFLLSASWQQRYHCSKDTAQKALIELKYQKYIYAVPKSGYYVLENAQEEKQDLELPVRDDRHQAYEDFRLCVNETLIGRENYLFNYYPQQEGLEDLRRSVQN